MIGCLIFAAVFAVGVAGIEIVTGMSGRKIDTTEGLELIRKAESADVAEIEAKIGQLELQESSGEETRSLKERFASTVVIGDSVTDGFLEYDVLNASSVITETGMNWEEQVARLQEVNPKVVFLTYCASDILDSDGDTDAYSKAYRQRIEDVRRALPAATIFVNSLFAVNTSASTTESRYGALEEYNQALEELCDRLQVGFADNGALELESYYEADGVHFNAAFYPVWAERMAEVASL